MNKRVIEISASLNKMAVVPEELTQGDKNTHFINLKFLKDVEVLGYQLLVFYKLPYPDERILVDTYNDLKTEMNILIPSEALKRSGELVIEFSLKKDEELITVNKNVTLNIISTINGTFVDATLEGNIKETIDQQVTKITTLLEQTQNKIDEYNDNTLIKIKEFDTHVENSKENINTYIEEKVAPTVDNYMETTIKPGIDSYVEKTSKDVIDAHVENTSKKQINDYVTLKEEEIKGATFTPALDELGNLSFTNDKNLPNPPVVNIKGEKGEAGAKGETGPQGIQGLQGEQGLPGEKGEKGDKGETGAVGPQGPAGEKPVNGVDYNTPQEEEKFKSEIIKQFDDVKLNKGTLPSEITSAEDLLSLMEKKAGATFDRNLLYLNDKGIKEEGKLYFDRNKQGLFKCKKTTTADYVVNSTDYFVDISNLENANRLDNLSGYKLVKEFTTTEINSTVEVFNYPEIVDNKDGGNYFTEILVTAHYSYSIYGNLFAGAIKLAGVPKNQKIASTIYKKQNSQFIEFDNSDDTLWRNHLLANIKGTNITFKVFVLKITL